MRVKQQDNQFIASIGSFALVVGFIAGVWFSNTLAQQSALYKYGNEAKEIKKHCEAELPRNKECIVNITAKPEQ